MQKNDSGSEKIISLKDAKSMKEKAASAVPGQEGENQKSLFDLLVETMNQNHKNKSRLEKERKDANKSVLRSYKIKN